MVPYLCPITAINNALIPTVEIRVIPKLFSVLPLKARMLKTNK